jgi:hypothetical protein
MRSRCLSVRLILPLLATLLACSGAAQGAEPPAKKPVPNYDGRPPPPTTAGDVAIWIPRVLASPFYGVSEYVLRRPLGALVTVAERDHWPAAILGFFTFGAEQKIGVIPTALVDFGFKPSVGLYFFWDDALVKGNAVRVHASTWGADWLSGSVADRIPILGDDASLLLRLEGVRRPDYIFHGLGPRSGAERTRYSADKVDARAAFAMRGWRASSLSTSVGFRDMHFADKGCCDDPTIGEGAALGRYELPAGFESGYSIAYQRVEAALDTRTKRPDPGSGMRLELEGEQGVSVPGHGTDHWLRYGGTLGAFLDLTNRWRVLSFAVTTLFVDPVGQRSTVPFTEAISLGGSGPMRGFLAGRLIDRSAAVATLQYQWPIWVWLDGAMQLAAGNVFGEHLHGFEPALCRLSWSLGLRTVGSPDHAFEVLGGFGTETFKDGARVSSARIVVGATRGF